ncbi:MAG: hypothetical protein ACI4JB_03135 [Porcipelethomonas sp.]
MKFRRLFLMCSVIAAMFSMSGCGDDTTADSGESAAVGTSSQEDETSTSENSDVTESESSNEQDTDGTVLAECPAYNVYSVNLGDNVYYPQISGMSDEQIQNKINEKLKSLEAERYDEMYALMETAKAEYEKAKESGTLDSSTEEILRANFETMYSAAPTVNYADEKILSITQKALFGTEEQQKNESGGSSTTCININMETGEELEISDIADTAGIAEKIYSQEGVTVIGDYENAGIDDFIEEKHIESAQDIKDYIGTYSSVSYDENGKLILGLSTSSGNVMVRID